MTTDLRIVRAALDRAFTTCVADDATKGLRPTLVKLSAGSFAAIQSGAVSEVQANGHRVKFAEPGEAGPSASELASVWVYLQDLFDRAKSELGGSPSDASVRNQMNLHLRPVLGCTANFMYISK